MTRIYTRKRTFEQRGASRLRGWGLMTLNNKDFTSPGPLIKPFRHKGKTLGSRLRATHEIVRLQRATADGSQNVKQMSVNLCCLSSQRQIKRTLLPVTSLPRFCFLRHLCDKSPKTSLERITRPLVSRRAWDPTEITL